MPSRGAGFQPAMKSMHRTRPAMGTLFEVLLLGDDEEHLTAVADAILDEVQRVERLLSRFDPRSEISRINRLAASEMVMVDHEVAALLSSCFEAREWTGGCFDITATSQTPACRRAAAEIDFDRQRRAIRFRSTGIQLDLGGVGKGYALDRAAELLAEYGAENALIHGGTSSVLARGHDGTGAPWRIALRQSSECREVIELGNEALSCSAINAQGDIIDPRSGEALNGEEGCAVIAHSATEAEILSTAVLCLGQERAEHLVRSRAADVKVVWIPTSIPAAVNRRLGCDL